MDIAAHWKVVWITGASTGIGREVALALARQGAKVAASARSIEKLEELRALSDRIFAYPLDVTDSQSVASTAAKIEAELGSIDLAILNAGVWHPMGASGFDVGKSRDSMEVNYFGIVSAVAALIPTMIARGHGHIAMTSSVAGYRGMPMAAAYAPSKAAVISLAEVLKPDLERKGVRVSVINPGFVDTPMTGVNDFPMPFMISAPDAANRILNGLRKGKFEIAFPWQMVLMMKAARLLPYPLYFWFARTFLTPSKS